MPFTVATQSDARLLTAAAWYFQRETARVAVERQRDQGFRPAAVQFDTDGIRTLSGFQENLHPWSTVTRVEEWAGLIVVILGWGRAFGIATGGMTEQERAAVLAVLRSRGTVQPA